MNKTTPGRGGGGWALPCIYCLGYVPRETPIFSPKNPLRSIIILHFLPLRRPWFSKFLYRKEIRNFFTVKKFQAIRRPQPAYCSQPERFGPYSEVRFNLDAV